MGRGDDPPGVDPFDLAAARRMYWAFHWGAPPDRELPLLGPRDIPRVTAQLGELVDLRLRHGELVRVTGGRVHLLTDQHGRHLYLGAEAPIATAFEPGRIVSIAYRTNKGGARDTWEHH
ncbi:MAG: hypothetical protein KC620_26120, partial [Myxococcales bacterium]|nr:hypothetical protein [Myxococcales bacterium]